MDLHRFSIVVYGVHMDTKTTTAGMVVKAMKKADRTKSWTARKADIPTTTFFNKLRGDSEFTISELGNIAKALSVHPADLLPAEFVKAAA